MMYGFNYERLTREIGHVLGRAGHPARMAGPIGGGLFPPGPGFGIFKPGLHRLRLPRDVRTQPPPRRRP